jgi:hypothetical protein
LTRIYRGRIAMVRMRWPAILVLFAAVVSLAWLDACREREAVKSLAPEAASTSVP